MSDRDERESSNLGPVIMIGLMTASHRIRKWVLISSLCFFGIGIVLGFEGAWQAKTDPSTRLPGFGFIFIMAGMLGIGAWCVAKVVLWLGRIVAEDIKGG